MAPTSKAKDVEAEIKDILQNFFCLMVQGFDHQGPPTQDAMKREVGSLIRNLASLSKDAELLNITVPPELITYVESSRNPDVYARELVESVQRMNQMLKGRNEAYRSLRDTLAKDIIAAIPELEGDVRKIMETTGDTLPA